MSLSAAQAADSYHIKWASSSIDNLNLIRKPFDRDLLLSTLGRALGPAASPADCARAGADPSI